MSLPLLLPLLAGIVYVVAAMLLKRATELGAGLWPSVRLCNYTTAVAFAPLLLLGGTIPSWQMCWQPAVVALLFCCGQVFTLLALNVGDVSVATPVLGVKILLVAFFTTAVTGEAIGPRLWAAAVLCSVGLALLNAGGSHRRRRTGATIALSAVAAASYAMFDVLVQAWVPAWGPGRFLPVMMGFLALFTPALRPVGSAGSSGSAARLDPAARRWLLAGAAFLSLQAGLIVFSIASWGHATAANALYSSRGLWSVLAAWAVAGRFPGAGPRQDRSVMAGRLAGAVLLTVAILIVLSGGIPERS